MTLHKLGTTDAFVVLDLGEGVRGVGPTRLAPRILVDGAELLARSGTYLFASFERQVGGASAGISARPDGRADAVAAFVTEVTPLVEGGAFTTEAARGLSPDDLAKLVAADPSPLPTGARRDELLVAGVVAAAERALGGLDGRTVAVEGWDQVPAPLPRALAARGATIVAVAGAAGAVLVPGGLDPALVDVPGRALTDLSGVGREAPAGAVWSAAADLLVTGSRAGVLDHTVSGDVAARAVVPWGPVPVTAKALADLGRRGVTVLPDFVALAGPPLAAVGGPAGDGEAGDVAAAVVAVLDEVMDHAGGPLLGACKRAEAYLRTWRETLPFGRPIA